MRITPDLRRSDRGGFSNAFKLETIFPNVLGRGSICAGDCCRADCSLPDGAPNPRRCLHPPLLHVDGTTTCVAYAPRDRRQLTEKQRSRAYVFFGSLTTHCKLAEPTRKVDYHKRKELHPVRPELYLLDRSEYGVNKKKHTNKYGVPRGLQAREQLRRDCGTTAVNSRIKIRIVRAVGAGTNGTTRGCRARFCTVAL